MRTRLTRERGGFSLIELLVTIFIAGVFFSAMVPLFVSAQKENSSDAARVLSITVGRDRIEKIRQLDYKEITLANLQSATFKGGQFGTVYPNVVTSTTTRLIYVTYAVVDMGQYKIVTVSTTWDNPATAKHELPQPAYTTVLKTEVYKQFSGPMIIAFDVLENGSSVAGDITAAQVTLRATINPGDVDSMDWDNPDSTKRGRISFVVMNSAGNVLERKDETVPVNGYDNRYEWVWNTGPYPDGQYTFVAVAYAADASEGNSWPKTYLFDKGPPVAPVVVADPGNTSVSLSWQCTPEPTDLKRYEVWRSSTGSSSGYVQIVPDTLSKTYLDSGLANGTTYWYRVAAVDLKDQLSFSTAVSATPVAPPPDTTGPTAPLGMSAAKAGPNVAAITLTWTTASIDNPPPASPSGLHHYVVQRASNAAFTTGLSTISTTHPAGNMSFTDATTGYSSTWYYRVAGVDANGNQGGWSAVVFATTDAPVMRSITATRSGGKYYVWVQGTLAPFLWYTTAGVSSTTRPAGSYGNKNSSVTFSNLPSGNYKVIYSLVASGTPQKGSIDANCSSGNATVSLP